MKNKIFVSRCENYKKDDVKSIILEGLNKLGGPGKFINNKQKICVKPNLLLPASPDKGITTHPVFIEAVIDVLAEYTGKPDNIVIADSFAPGVPFTRSGIEKIYGETGLLGIAERTGCRLNFSTDYSRVSNRKGRLLKKIDIINVVRDCQVIINLPKFKTHNLTTITGAIKNMFGVVPGFTKVGYHLRFDDINNFTGMLLDLVTLIKPTLNIMDGILGIEGDGPGRSGTPRNIGLVMISDDPVTMDLIMGHIMNVDEEHNPFIKIARERGLRSAFWENIEMMGTRIDELIITDYKLPKSVGQEKLIENRFISKYIIPRIRTYLNPYPYADMNKCSNCLTCQKVCPQKAVICTESNVKFDYSNCIRCFCCSEMCPEGAIDIKYSFLGNLIMNRFGLAGVRK
jgi:uncharacterized protein (DUF362 family)/Pyruvate/2-oxoacid:ferredoxin oxidoreductase delta subunit